jgi:hypothetical protein
MLQLAKFFGLSLADKLFLLYCALIVAFVRIGLSLFSYRSLRGCLRQNVVHAVSDNDVTRRIVWAVRNSARIVPRASCLTQALAAQFLLARAGYQSQMRVGVAMDTDGRFVAHAWLVSEGRIVLGGTAQEVQRYATLTDLSLGPP